MQDFSVTNFILVIAATSSDHMSTSWGIDLVILQPNSSLVPNIVILGTEAPPTCCSSLMSVKGQPIRRKVT